MVKDLITQKDMRKLRITPVGNLNLVIEHLPCTRANYPEVFLKH